MKKLLALFLAFAMVFSSVAALAEIDLDIAADARTVAGEVYPLDTWDGKVDISWYDPENPQTEYTITTAEQWAGLAQLVNDAESYSPAMGNEDTADFGWYCNKQASPNDTANGIDFEGVTIKLAADLDLCAVYENVDPVLLPGRENLSMAPVGYSTFTPFKGTFDGQGHTIKNLFQGGWDMYKYADSGDGVYLGLFGVVEDATIKNLVVDNFAFNCEMNLGAVAGISSGTSTFDNITIKNSTIATGGGWWVGGLIGWAYGNQTISNINIDETNTVAQVGGHYDTAVGGIIGGCNNVDGETIAFEDCYVACKLDVYNDCTANYDTGVYRNCGMVIGGVGESNETVIDGIKYPDCTSKGITLKNVEVIIGEWANYTYCWSYALTRNCQRVEPGVGYNGVDLSNVGEYSITSRPFNAIFGAENAGDTSNVRGPVTVEVMEFLKSQNLLEATNVTVTDKALEERAPAKIGDELVDVTTLQEVIDIATEQVAETGNSVTVKLNKAVPAATTIVFKANNTISTFATSVVVAPGVTLDLNDFTLTGNIIVEDGAVANIKNGTIINENKDVSAIETKGNATLTDVNVESARHAVRVEGGTTVIESGKYEIDNSANQTIKVINVSDGSIVTIKGGTFIANDGPSEVTSAVASRDTSVVTIEGGNFFGGEYDTLVGETASNIVVKGGSFDRDPSAYVAVGYNAYNDINSMYTVKEAATDDEKLTIEFAKADVDTAGNDNLEGEDIYNINVVNEDGINRLNSADLTFLFTPNAVNGCAMAYEILEVEGSKISVTPHPTVADRYMFNYDTKAGVVDTDTSITIGQVKFTGYGSYDFEIVGDENEVHATTITDNIVDTYNTTGAVGKGTLDISAKLDDVVNPVPVRTLKVQIAFPNAIEENADTYQDMMVEISGNFEGVQKTVVYKLGDGSSTPEYEVVKMTNNGYVVTNNDLVLNEAYNVTVSGAGYRTARYTVTMTEDKTLNFWNNVKDKLTVVEVGKQSSEATVTFLAGDIVKDNQINIYDLSAVVSYFGSVKLDETNPDYVKYDLNRDRKIDSKDVAYVLVSWGK